jgi:6-phosphogluconolactonase
MRHFLPVTKPEIIVCHDANELSRTAAERFAALAKAAVSVRGRFSVALSGGSTPKALYALLATDEFRSQLPWQELHLFWGDERCVPPDHGESNFRMVREALLSKITIPSENIHRMAGEKPPADGAADYQAQLQKFFHLADGAWPRFDLVLLGLGEDGHTASLFPGSAALNEQQRWVATSYVEKLHAHRLTLTFPLINHAAQISFLVSGASKAPIVEAIICDSNDSLPAARIQPVDGQVTWFVTQDAAGALAKR